MIAWLGYAAADVKKKQPLNIKELAEESTKKAGFKEVGQRILWP